MPLWTANLPGVQYWCTFLLPLAFQCQVKNPNFPEIFRLILFFPTPFSSILFICTGFICQNLYFIGKYISCLNFLKFIYATIRSLESIILRVWQMYLPPQPWDRTVTWPPQSPLLLLCGQPLLVPLASDNHWSTFYPCSFAFSSMSYTSKWIHAICSFRDLASFIVKYSFFCTRS